MGTVTLYDGRKVDSASEAWRAECEARAILEMDVAKREQFWQAIEQKRGADALKALKRRCFELEPYYVLNLPNKHQRRAYLEQVERRFGPNPAEALRAKVLELHSARQAVASGDAQAA